MFFQGKQNRGTRPLNEPWVGKTVIGRKRQSFPPDTSSSTNTSGPVVISHQLRVSFGSRTFQVSFQDGGKEPPFVSSSKKVILLKMGTPPPCFPTWKKCGQTGRGGNGTLWPEHFLRSFSGWWNLSIKNTHHHGLQQDLFLHPAGPPTQPCWIRASISQCHWVWLMVDLGPHSGELSPLGILEEDELRSFGSDTWIWPHRGQKTRASLGQEGKEDPWGAPGSRHHSGWQQLTCLKAWSLQNPFLADSYCGWSSLCPSALWARRKSFQGQISILGRAPHIHLLGRFLNSISGYKERKKESDKWSHFLEL